MNKNKLRKKRILCAVLSTALLTNSFHVAAAASAASSYKDGTYTGTASGFLDDITVSVTVTDGSIAAIDVTEQKDTPSYWERAEAVIPEIIAANGTEGIDAVRITLIKKGTKYVFSVFNIRTARRFTLLCGRCSVRPERQKKSKTRHV